MCDCESGSTCTFAAALECGARERACGAPLQLQVEPGVHIVRAVVLNARLCASHVVVTRVEHSALSEEVDVWLQPADFASPVLIIGDDSPPLTMRRIGFRGAMLVNDSLGIGPHVIDDCVFNGSQPVSGAGRAVGGGIQVHSGMITVESTTFQHLSAENGGALALTGAAASAHILRSHLTGNRAYRHGGAIYVSGGRLTLDRVSITANDAGAKGGGLYVERGFVFLRDESVIANNSAQPSRCDGGLCGVSFFIVESEQSKVFYALPAPPASYIMLTSDCREASFQVTPGLRGRCYPHPELRDAIVAEIRDHAYDAEFPSRCPAGAYGRAGDVEAQRGNECSGACPAGYQCRLGTADPEVCPAGFYCDSGTPRAVPCPGGTYSTIPRLRSLRGCHPVPAGSYAPQGSPAPIDCPSGGYICPGARLSPGGGAAPIPLSRSGVPRTINTTVEISELVMPLSMMLDTAVTVQNVSTVLRDVLAAHIGVPEDMVIIDTAPSPALRRLSEQTGTAELSVRFREVPGLITANALETSLGSVNDATLDALLRDVPEMANASASRGGRDLVTLQVNFTNSTQVEDPCPPGFWCTAGEKIACTRGTYNPEAAQSLGNACINCPEHATSAMNSTSILECYCDVGYVNVQRDPRLAAVCHRCSGGTLCAEEGIYIETLPLKVGFYRISPHSLDVRRCPDASLNCTLTDGSYGECAHGTSACRGGVQQSARVMLPNSSSTCSEIMGTFNEQCADGLVGPFCQLCDPTNTSFGKRRFYEGSSESRQAQCYDCLDLLSSTGVRNAFLLLVASAALVTALVFIAKRYFPLYLDEWTRYFRALGLLEKLKHCYGFYVIVTKIESVYKVELPVEVKVLLDRLAVIFSFGIDVRLIPKDCFGILSHINRLHFWMVLPVAAIFILVIPMLARLAWRGHFTRDRIISRCMPLIMGVLFLAYPKVTTVAFESFSCHRFTVVEATNISTGAIDTGKQCFYMMTDPATECVGQYTPNDEVLFMAWLAILIYPVGVLVLTAVLLILARKDIIARRPTPLSGALGFLHRDVRPRYYWWELMEMLRRLFLIGFLVVIEPGSLLQLCLGSAACLPKLCTGGMLLATSFLSVCVPRIAPAQNDVRLRLLCLPDADDAL